MTRQVVVEDAVVAVAVQHRDVPGIVIVESERATRLYR